MSLETLDGVGQSLVFLNVCSLGLRVPLFDETINAKLVSHITLLVNWKLSVEFHDLVSDITLNSCEHREESMVLI